MPHNDDKKVFDVARPGQTAANASGRPVIVGHKTLLQDPMVTSQAPADDKEEGPKPASDTTSDEPEAASGEPDASIKLLPPPETAIEPPEVDESSDTDSPPDEPKPEDSISIESEEATPPIPEPDKVSPPHTDSPNPSHESKGTDDEQVESAQNATYQKLVEDKTYFAPIGEQKRKRSLRRLLIICILVLLTLIVAADLLIDSGVIKTSIKPPVSIFHN